MFPGRPWAFSDTFFIQHPVPTVRPYSPGKTVCMAFSHPCAEPPGGSTGDTGGVQESFWGGESSCSRELGSGVSALVLCTQICCWGRFTPQAITFSLHTSFQVYQRWHFRHSLKFVPGRARRHQAEERTPHCFPRQPNPEGRSRSSSAGRGPVSLCPCFSVLPMRMLVLPQNPLTASGEMILLTVHRESRILSSALIFQRPFEF